MEGLVNEFSGRQLERDLDQIRNSFLFLALHEITHEIVKGRLSSMENNSIDGCCG